jgi:two-component system sensor histidine kinase KdpD
MGCAHGRGTFKLEEMEPLGTMERLGRLNRQIPGGRATAAAAAILLPILATLVGVVFNLGPFAPPSLYLLAVVVAAAVGGPWSGLAAAALSFLGLNYYFTPPTHTLRVADASDIVALFVFLGIAVVVGSLFAGAVAERERTERRENDLRLVNRFATWLLRADLDGRTVGDIATTLVHAMGLRRCRISVRGLPELSRTVSAPVAASDGETPPAGKRLEVPISSGDEHLGEVVVEREARAFSGSDRSLLEATAGQLGLAIERSRLETEARTARTGAEISEIRAALFSSVTHDLRTPLASIKAGITSLQDEDVAYDPEARKELFSTVLEETDRLNRLVDNLLSLARARAGDIALEKELTPFEDVVETVVARLRDVLAGLDVRAMIRPDLPGVWIDPVKMDSALSNVIENAARHSRPGGEIQISVAPWHGGIQVRVADHGPGIPEEERDLVFEPFYRGASRVGAGSGLGLAIARAVVQAHGGRIRIEGAPGGGTAVVIELPEGAPDDSAEATTSEVTEP